VAGFPERNFIERVKRGLLREIRAFKEVVTLLLTTKLFRFKSAYNRPNVRQYPLPPLATYDPMRHKSK
jgi:hypothetical protein